MSSAIVAVLAGGVAAAAIYGGLAFQSTVTGNAQAALGAAIGIGGGVLVGMMGAPDAGVGIAAGGVGVALAQFSTSEVAAYQANQATPSTSSSTSTSGPGDRLPLRSVNSINGPGDTLPVHTRNAMAAARMRLAGRGLR